MHRTLKSETASPPAASVRAQQRKFNRFREEFNQERPHEALDMQTPASCYETSPREMPSKLPPLEYPDRFEVRYVSANGGIRWKKHAWVNVSHGVHRRVRRAGGDRRRGVGRLLRAAHVLGACTTGTCGSRMPTVGCSRHSPRRTTGRVRPITMPCADQRLRSASSPISASTQPSTEEKPAFGAEICQGCPRTLLSTISPRTLVPRTATWNVRAWPDVVTESEEQLKGAARPVRDSRGAGIRLRPLDRRAPLR